MKKALRTAGLALVLLVTTGTTCDHVGRSCPLDSPLVPGPVQLAVETTCGPSGTVTMEVDPETCAITLDGAAAVELPAGGTMYGTSFTLWEGDADFHCPCSESATGEWTVRCYQRSAEGCSGGDLPVCDGVLTLVVP